jgi:hypothetical protein
MPALGFYEWQVQADGKSMAVACAKARKTCIEKTPGQPRRLDPVNNQDPRSALQSSNGQWDNTHAATGATETSSSDWRDDFTPPKPTRLPFQVVGTPNRSNMDAALDAIKQDLARGAKQVGG